MNRLLRKLSGGDLRSDGRANEVAEEVIRNPQLYEQLLAGLNEPDDVIRGRTAHALERVSRANQHLFRGVVPQLVNISMSDGVPMVKWHLAMIFGNIAFAEKDTEPAVSALYHLLASESVFVRSWAISSLCIIGTRDKRRRGEIIDAVKVLRDDKSVAIRTRAAKAMRVLQDENERLPVGWSKT